MQNLFAVTVLPMLAVCSYLAESIKFAKESELRNVEGVVVGLKCLRERERRIVGERHVKSRFRIP